MCSDPALLGYNLEGIQRVEIESRYHGGSWLMGLVRILILGRVLFAAVDYKIQCPNGFKGAWYAVLVSLSRVLSEETPDTQ